MLLCVRQSSWVVVTCEPHANDVARFFEKINNDKRDIFIEAVLE